MRFRSLVWTLVLAFAMTPCTYAEDFTARAHKTGKARKIWKISAAVLGAVTIADVQSSMGRPELNPILRGADGRFSSRGVSLKTAIVGGALLGQYLMLRRNPEASGWAAGANFAAAAATSAVVARNHMR